MLELGTVYCVARPIFLWACVEVMNADVFTNVCYFLIARPVGLSIVIGSADWPGASFSAFLTAKKVNIPGDDLESRAAMMRYLEEYLSTMTPRRAVRHQAA